MSPTANGSSASGGVGSTSVPGAVPGGMFGGKSLGLNTRSYLRYAEERTFVDSWVETFKRPQRNPRGSYR